MFKAIWKKMLILNVLVVAGIIYLLTFDNTGMIAARGILWTNRVISLLWLIAGAAFAIGNAVIIRNYFKNQYRPKRTIPESKLTLDEKEALDIDKVAEQIFNLRRERPQLRDIFSQAMDQIDSAREKQSQIRTVFRNAPRKMDDVVATIDETAQTICANLSRLVKRAVIWNPEDADKKGRSDILAEHKKYMRKYLDKNEEILAMCDKLISETLTYLEESDSGSDNSVSLESTTAMIQTLRSMSSSQKNPFERD
jgi:hypothetical protein